jgi:ABC-type sulfate/molybdate transport systems ATPase subunit
LDEPSTALDLLRSRLRLIFRKLAQADVGIVMVTHPFRSDREIEQWF